MTRVIKSVFAIKALLLTSLYGMSIGNAASPEERDAWNAARMVNSPAAYQSFMESFPTSEYAADALSSMVESVESAPGSTGGASGTGETY